MVAAQCVLMTAALSRLQVSTTWSDCHLMMGGVRKDCKSEGMRRSHSKEGLPEHLGQMLAGEAELLEMQAD